MKTFILSSLFLTFGHSLFSQSFNPFYASLANACDQDTISNYLQDFENLGIKEVNTAALENTKNWIIQKYNDWGYSDIVEDDFNVFGNSVMTNIIITKTGTVYPDNYVIIDAHYDTKNGPGANDNGSGTVLLLELARLLKDIPTEYSIKFIHFSGEEIGLEGSEHFVANIANVNNMDIKVVFNIDQVGGTAGTINNTIICERDESVPTVNNVQSAILTDELAACTELYSNLQTEISYAYASDYVPFMLNGYAVTGYYEKNDSPYTHSIQDSIIRMDIPYLYQVTKGAMGALLHYVVGIEELGLETLSPNKYLGAYPNPAEDHLHLRLTDFEFEDPQGWILDITGTLVTEVNLVNYNNHIQCNVASLASGTYLLRVKDGSRTFTAKFIKK